MTYQQFESNVTREDFFHIFGARIAPTMWKLYQQSGSIERLCQSNELAKFRIGAEIKTLSMGTM